MSKNVLAERVEEREHRLKLKWSQETKEIEKKVSVVGTGLMKEGVSLGDYVV